MKINTKTFIPIETLRHYESQKLLRSQDHSSLNLIIWNYSDVVQFKSKWDEVTLHCRGLVTDTEGNIVARSFKKFFNLGETQTQNIQVTPSFKVFLKLDGSLGLLFWYKDQWVFASRGSFHSDQANVGFDILKEKNPNYVKLDKSITYVFEIIYPENRIVVDYGDRKEVVFLAGFTRDGEEVIDLFNTMREMGFDVVQEVEPSDYNLLKARNVDNEEGYVVLFDNMERVKIKFDKYLELHRSVTNLSEKQILQWFMEKKDIEEICTFVPDEFMDWMRCTFNEIKEKYDFIVADIEEKIQLYFSENQKEFALKIQSFDQDFRSLLFARKANKANLHLLVCNYIKKNNYEKSTPQKITNKLLKKQKDNKKTTVNNDLEKHEKIEENSETVGQKTKEENKEYLIKHQKNTKLSKLIILVGISGSGKSSWAKEYISKNKASIIVSRDNLRKLLFNLENEDLPAYYSKRNDSYEGVVTAFQGAIIKDALEKKYTVIVDNTNLQRRSINELMEHISKDTVVEIKRFDTPVEECIHRVTKRERKVPESVIRKQHIEYGKIKDSLNFEGFLPINSDPNLPKCTIFDIDGTLALHHSGRSPFDETKVLEDSPNIPIVEICQMLFNAGKIIILCSGRSENCRSDTEEWLRINGIQYLELYLRNTGDNRKDFKVKDDQWRIISKSYNINLIFDDRNQVVKHARRIGLNVCQVNEGNF